MDKTNYSVARVETYTRASIVKAERHNERKNESYSNMNVDLTQTPNNVHYKRCKNTYNERLLLINVPHQNQVNRKPIVGEKNISV